MRCDMKCEKHGTPLVRHPEDVELTTEPVDCPHADRSADALRVGTHAAALPLCDAYYLWIEGGHMEVDETVGNALQMLTNIGLGLVEWKGEAAD